MMMKKVAKAKVAKGTRKKKVTSTAVNLDFVYSAVEGLISRIEALEAAAKKPEGA